MAEKLYAKAFPRKRFFIEMFTRDISLHDCILDLIDNSIDATIRLLSIDISRETRSTPQKTKPRLKIRVDFSQNAFRIEDNCGGIPLERAQNDVFNFGHSSLGFTQLTQQGLGAYGIGLKRALFKIGSHFELRSRTTEAGFEIKEDLKTWVQKDDSLQDWRFSIQQTAPAPTPSQAGTHIKITGIEHELAHLLGQEYFADLIKDEVARTYAPFLGRYVDVFVNHDLVSPRQIPLGYSPEYDPSSEQYADDSVDVRLVAGLAVPNARGEWQMEYAGWYVLCNGRVVVAADKTSLTGWGAGILPQFHSSKHRGFIGLAFFKSSDPLKLPWTTTKRGLNRESPVYLRARNRMQSVARQVTKYLDKVYGSQTDVTPEERNAARDVTQADVSAASTKTSAFRSPPRRQRRDTRKIQYDAKIEDLELIAEHLRSPGMHATDIGRHTFEYFMKQEGLK